MPDELKKRWTAHKVSLGMLHKGSVEFEEGRFSRLIFNNKELVRVNVIATVVDKFMNEQGSYGTITLDDGTGRIRAKAFSDSISMLKDLEPGDTVIVIGLLRHYGNELYILPEIIKQIDSRWLLARKLELMKEYGPLYEATSETDEMKTIQENLNLRDKILNIIKNHEQEEGIDIDKLIMMLEEPAEEINMVINKLLEEGAIFEPRPGRLRIL